MTTAQLPDAPESFVRESGTSDQMSHEVYPRRQQQSQPEAKYAQSDHVQESAETSLAKSSAYYAVCRSQNTGADTAFLEGKPIQQSKSTGLMGRITEAVDLFIPNKARQKDVCVHKQRRVSALDSSDPTGKLRGQARRRGRSLESRQRLEEEDNEEIATLRDQLYKLQYSAKQDARKLRDMADHAANMNKLVCMLRDDVKTANSKAAALAKTVAENEAIITQANATAVSRLASNVSREFTDDMISEALRKFFQTEFFSWCADLCAEKIEYEELALHKLLAAGIINASYRYLNGPEYLKFKINTPDGSGPLVLLQAALANRLCDLYLTDAYFLAQDLPANFQDRCVLSQLEWHFSHAGQKASFDWRVQTVECLEQAVPITEAYVSREVHNFVQEYGFLLSRDQYDLEASRDLARIFVNFATLALKLWKSRSNVQWSATTECGGVYRALKAPWMEVNTSMALSTDQRLNGRPIGLIIRPAIWSKSLTKDGAETEVIWLKALAWVSEEDDVMDFEREKVNHEMST